MELLAGAQICESAYSQTACNKSEPIPFPSIFLYLLSHEISGAPRCRVDSHNDARTECKLSYSCWSKSQVTLERGRVFSTLLRLPALLNCSSAGSLTSPHTGSALSQISDWWFNIKDLSYYVALRHCGAPAPITGCLCGALNHISHLTWTDDPSESFWNSIPFPKWNLMFSFPKLIHSIMILSLQCLSIFSMLTAN